MSYTLEITEAAQEDIREAFLYYESQKEDLGTRFEAHITQAIEQIQQNPLHVQIRYGSTRVLFLKKFPYGIHYQVYQEKISILIIAVFHTARDPRKWKGRES